MAAKLLRLIKVYFYISDQYYFKVLFLIHFLTCVIYLIVS